MATLNLQKAKFDLDAVKKGRWVELSQGGKVLVARLNNPRYRALETKLYQQYRRPRSDGKFIKGGIIPPEVQEEITLELVTQTLLMDWDEFANGGEAYPCTNENKRTLLSQEEYRWIMEEVMQAARDEEEYQQTTKEEDLGNSRSASASDSSGTMSSSSGLSN